MDRKCCASRDSASTPSSVITGPVGSGGFPLRQMEPAPCGVCPLRGDPTQMYGRSGEVYHHHVGSMRSPCCAYTFVVSGESPRTIHECCDITPRALPRAT